MAKVRGRDVKKRRPYSEKEDAYITQEYIAGGTSIPVIAKNLDRTNSSVSSRIQRLKLQNLIPYVRETSRVSNVSMGEEKRIRELRAQGISYAKIAQMVGRGQATVYKHCQKLGDDPYTQNENDTEGGAHEKTQPSLEEILNSLPEGSLVADGVSLRHKEMLIEILHKVFV